MSSTNTGRVSLSVAERLGVPRRNEWVRSGVPFPKGALKSGDQARLVGVGGEVPLDAEALVRWEDGSVKWLLLDFATDAGAGEAVSYSLEYGDSIARTEAERLKVKQSPEAFHVDTGAIRFEINRQKFSVLSNAQVKDERGNWFTVSTQGLDFLLKNYDHRPYTATHEACDYDVALEEAGGVHAVFCVRGTLTLSGRKRVVDHFQYTCRIYCWAGSPSVKVTFTLQNRQEQANEIFRSVEMALHLDDTRRAVLGWADSAKEIAVSDDSDILAVQAGPTNLIPWEEFSYKLIDNAEGAALDRCAKSPGWAAVEGESAGAAMSVRRFWEKHPKGFSVSSGKLSACIRPLGGDNMVFPRGMDYSDDILLTFYSAKDRDKAVDKSLAFQDTLFAVAPPEWYCGSDAVGWLSPVSKQDFARYERLISSSFDGLVKGQAEEKMYGDINFGDASGDYTTQRDYWLNQEYDTPHCCFLMFLRSGSLDYLKWGEDAARHHADIDTVHYCPDNPEMVGGQYKHEFNHTSYRSAGTLYYKPTIDHIWAEGLCDCYLLTGDRRMREVAEEVGEHTMRHVSQGINKSTERSYGWPIILLYAIYQATGDGKYLDGIKMVVKQVMDKRHPTRGVWQKSWGVDENGNEILGSKTFMVGLLMEAMAFYHHFSGDPEVADWLVKAAGTICTEAWVEKDQGFYYTPSLADRDQGRTSDLRQLVGLAYAYSISREPLFVEIALKSFEAGQNTHLQRLQVNGAVSGKGFSTLTRSTPRFMALAQELGLWKDDHSARG